MVVSGRYKKYINKVMDPFGKLFAAWRVSPNFITFASLALAIIAAVLLVLNKNFFIFGAMVLLLNFFDLLDGAIARASGKCTKIGSYLDAMVDRYIEAIILFAVGLVAGYWKLIFIVLFGSTCTAYAKARTAQEVEIDNVNWPDLMEALERGIAAVVILLIRGFTRPQVYYEDAIFWGLIFLAIFTNITVLQRGYRAIRIISNQDVRRPPTG